MFIFRSTLNVMRIFRSTQNSLFIYGYTWNPMFIFRYTNQYSNKLIKRMLHLLLWLWFASWYYTRCNVGSILEQSRIFECPSQGNSSSWVHSSLDHRHYNIIEFYKIVYFMWKWLGSSSFKIYMKRIEDLFGVSDKIWKNQGESKRPPWYF